MKFPLAAVLLLTVLVFWPGIVPAFSGDDHVHTYKNRHSPSQWYRYFLEPDGREYRPLVRLSLALDHQLWRGRPQGYHVTNLALHLITTLLVFSLVRSLTNNPLAALMASALFSTHPIHTYSVNAIMGRTDVLCTIFYVGAVRAAHLGRRTTKAGATLPAAFFFVLALLSKELAVTLPFLIWTFALLWPTHVKRDPRLLATLFAIDFSYLLLRLLLSPPGVQELAPYTSSGPSQVLQNLLFYTGGLVFPFAAYTLRYWFENLPTATTALFAIIAGGATILGLWSVRSWLKAPFWMGTIWSGVVLVPVLLLFQRRFLYLASVGFCLAAGWLLSRCKRRTALGILGLILVSYSWASHRASQEWGAAGKLGLATVKSILTQVPDLRHVELFLINVPNGIGEAHLFTHDSLRFALARELDKVPNVHVLTRIQMSPNPLHGPRILAGDDYVATRIQPGPQDYFVFDTPELRPRGGRFLPVGTRLNKGPFFMEVTANTPLQQVSEVTVRWRPLTPTQRLLPVTPIL